VRWVKICGHSKSTVRKRQITRGQCELLPFGQPVALLQTTAVIGSEKPRRGTCMGLSGGGRHPPGRGSPRLYRGMMDLTTAVLPTMLAVIN
jgi:hypothetical protein